MSIFPVLLYYINDMVWVHLSWFVDIATIMRWSAASKKKLKNFITRYTGKIESMNIISHPIANDNFGWLLRQFCMIFILLIFQCYSNIRLLAMLFYALLSAIYVSCKQHKSDSNVQQYDSALYSGIEALLVQSGWWPLSHWNSSNKISRCLYIAAWNYN